MDNMNITAAQYFYGEDGTNSGIQATIDGTEMSVPLDLANQSLRRDTQAGCCGYTDNS